MPFSSQNGKETITKFLHFYLRYRPSIGESLKVLDIGVGSGTYSNLYRNKLQPGDEHWTGVEIWEPYVEKYDLHLKYDRVLIQDARELKREFDLDTYFDIAFVGDVLEHMTLSEARELVDTLSLYCRLIIISIPIGHYPQDEWEGNPFERHVKDDWTVEQAQKTFKPNALYLDGDIAVMAIGQFLPSWLKGPRVSAYGIFKNEAKFIQRFLDRAWEAGFAELVLCDTGSNDQTWLLIHEWICQHPEAANWLKVFNINVMPWRFDEARNTALSFVSPHADLCVSIDIDEYMTDDSVLKLFDAWRKNKEATRFIHKFKTFWSDDPVGRQILDDLSDKNISEHFHERIHARRGYRWSLPVHEILEKYDGPEIVEWATDVWMYQRPDTTKERSNYFELLKQSVVERPDIWKSWSFLAGEYSWRGDIVNARDCIEKALTCKNADAGFLHYQLASFIPGTEEAISLLLKAFANSPCRELATYVADEYHRQGKTAMAKLYITAAAANTNMTQGYMYNPACWDERFEEKQRAYSL